MDGAGSDATDEVGSVKRRGKTLQTMGLLFQERRVELFEWMGEEEAFDAGVIYPSIK